MSAAVSSLNSAARTVSNNIGSKLSQTVRTVKRVSISSLSSLQSAVSGTPSPTSLADMDGSREGAGSREGSRGQNSPLGEIASVSLESTPSVVVTDHESNISVTSSSEKVTSASEKVTSSGRSRSSSRASSTRGRSASVISADRPDGHVVKNNDDVSVEKESESVPRGAFISIGGRRMTRSDSAPEALHFLSRPNFDMLQDSSAVIGGERAISAGMIGTLGEGNVIGGKVLERRGLLAKKNEFDEDGKRSLNRSWRVFYVILSGMRKELGVESGVESGVVGEGKV